MSPHSDAPQAHDTQHPSQLLTDEELEMSTPSFLGIPRELRHEILSLLPDKEIIPIRLLCKELAIRVMYIVMKRAAEVHLHSTMDSDDLEHMLSVLQNPMIAEKVRKVSFSCLGKDGVVFRDAFTESEKAYAALERNKDLEQVTSMRKVLDHLAILPKIHEMEVNVGCTFDPTPSSSRPFSINKIIRHIGRNEFVTASKICINQSFFLDLGMHIALKAFKGSNYSVRNVRFLLRAHDFKSEVLSDKKLCDELTAMEMGTILDPNEAETLRRHFSNTLVSIPSTFFAKKLSLAHVDENTVRPVMAELRWLDIHTKGRVPYNEGHDIWSGCNLAYSSVLRILYKAMDNNKHVLGNLQNSETGLTGRTSGLIQPSKFAPLAYLPFHGLVNLEVGNFESMSSTTITRFVCMCKNLERLTVKNGVMEFEGMSHGWGTLFQSLYRVNKVAGMAGRKRLRYVCFDKLFYEEKRSPTEWNGRNEAGKSTRVVAEGEVEVDALLHRLDHSYEVFEAGPMGCEVSYSVLLFS